MRAQLRSVQGSPLSYGGGTMFNDACRLVEDVPGRGERRGVTSARCGPLSTIALAGAAVSTQVVFPLQRHAQPEAPLSALVISVSPPFAVTTTEGGRSPRVPVEIVARLTKLRPHNASYRTQMS